MRRDCISRKDRCSRSRTRTSKPLASRFVKRLLRDEALAVLELYRQTGGTVYNG